MEVAQTALAASSVELERVHPIAQALSVATSPCGALGLPERSEFLIPKSRMRKRARPDLWGAWEGNLPGLPNRTAAWRAPSLTSWGDRNNCPNAISQDRVQELLAGHRQREQGEPQGLLNRAGGRFTSARIIPYQQCGYQASDARPARWHVPCRLCMCGLRFFGRNLVRQ